MSCEISSENTLHITGAKRLLEELEPEDSIAKKTKNESDVNGTESSRRRLRKYALLISYSGKGYLGMQRNPGFQTIEDDLLNAMLKAGLITEEVCTCPQMYKFQRAARTDKGVSAARQIVSMKLPDDVDLPTAINEHLVDQIRVMKTVRVTQKFDAKMQCDSRTYSYMTPTFAFAPLPEKTNEDYRMTENTVENVRDILNTYKGTHRFHNFTARVKPNEDRAKRYIMDINCSSPFIRDGLEWVIIKITGQSFMLHQIRKMMGLAMAVSRGLVTKEVFLRAWKPERCDIPISPGVGLVLEEPHYNYYNKKYGDDGIHEKLSWETEKEAIQSFKEEFIESVIVQTEKEEKVTLSWLDTLPLHTFGDRNKVVQLKGTKPELKPLLSEDSSNHDTHSPTAS